MERVYGDVDYMTGCRALEVRGLIRLVWNESRDEWGYEVMEEGCDVLEACGWTPNDTSAQALILAAYLAEQGSYESLEAALSSDAFRASEAFKVANAPTGRLTFEVPPSSAQSRLT